MADDRTTVDTVPYCLLSAIIYTPTRHVTLQRCCCTAEGTTANNRGMRDNSLTHQHIANIISSFIHPLNSSHCKLQ